MSKSKHTSRESFQRKPQLEQFEQRLVMSADPLGQITNDYLVEDELGPQIEQQLESLDDQLQQTLADAHEQTGLDHVRADFGLTGAGQTVAVIDSGIAWDHYALGGGFGADYRVVGGWDFAENDANPYDDPILGAHGTHVSGIIGADAGANSGVAPGADIVALRVFNDNGVGYLEWVEDALQWVLENREAYENPITTINLSLGTNWNSDTVPNWATLEDEFAALEDAGVFISVAAGNSFTQYNEKGLSYPAVSDYVVPVASVDDDGQMSYFSQRDDRVIAAPGRSITSTVPDYVGNQNNRTDDWASFSGTSMAAPYVAGSSMLIREAMQIAGWSNITQDAIYDVMVDTADQVWDGATNSYYNVLNLEAAINFILPADDFGSTADTAHDLGTLSDTKSITGSIESLTDRDYISFTAGADGTVTIDATTGGTPHWITSEGTTSGGSYTLDVVAGETYTIGLATPGHRGEYTLELNLAADDGLPESTDWGRLDFARLGTTQIDGESWYRFTADNDALVTVEALFSGNAGDVELELYDENMQLVASSAANANGQRLDLATTAGTTFYLRASGSSDAVDFRVTNLVSQSGRTVSVADTVATDDFRFTGGDELTVSINGVSYQFQSDQVDHVFFYGSAGDAARLNGTNAYEVAKLRAHNVQLAGANYQANVVGVDRVVVDGHGGGDRAYLYDTAGNDSVSIAQDLARITGDDFENVAQNVDYVYAHSTGGDDTAQLTGTSGADSLLYQNGTTALTGTGFAFRAFGFSDVAVNGGGGADMATLHGTAGNDTLWMTPRQATLSGEAGQIVATGFSQVTAHSGGGADRVYFEDSLGDDTFRAGNGQASLTGAGFDNRAQGYTRYYAFASAGNDTAHLTGTASNETLTLRGDYAKLSGGLFYAYASAFDSLLIDGGGGNDSATLHAGPGGNTLWLKPGEATLNGVNVSLRALGFSQITAHAGSAADRVYFEDSLGDDTFRANAESASMVGSAYANTAYGFGRYYAFASAGNDRAVLTPAGGERISRGSNFVKVSGNEFYAYASGFDTAQVLGQSDPAPAHGLYTPGVRNSTSPAKTFVAQTAAKPVATTPAEQAALLVQMRGFADVATAGLIPQSASTNDEGSNFAQQLALETADLDLAPYDFGQWDGYEHARRFNTPDDSQGRDDVFGNWVE